MIIFCCQCKTDVEARLTDGQETYPNRTDLYILPFWICDNCKNFVGCHHLTNERTRPLGVIPTKGIKKMRMAIHNTIDPIWKQFKGKTANKMRRAIYNHISDMIGKEYHSGELRTIEDAVNIYNFVRNDAFKEHFKAKTQRYTERLNN